MSSWLKKVTGAMTAVLLVAAGGLVAAEPAMAAPAAALQVTKLIDGQTSETVAPGDEFTYSIRLGCDDEDCVNAQITDPFPAELDGFQIIDFSVSPPNPAPPAQPNWIVSHTGCGGDPATEITADPRCIGTVQFVTPLVSGEQGLPAGQAYTLSMTVKVPDDLPPTWAHNDQTITNTGTGTADNADTKASSADVVVSIPTTVDTATTKSWEPTSAKFSPGAESTITSTTQNTSNVPADSLVIQDPTTAEDGAATLSADNPFAYTDFVGFGAVTMPAGATQVQVDAYVYDPGSGTYSWVNGDPGPPESIALPGGVAPEDVAGIRYTFTGPDGATIDAGGAAGSVETSITQRETNRDTDASLQDGWAMTNSVTGTVTVPGHDPASANATADHTVTPISVAVTAAKSIDPARIPAGTSAVGTVSGTNTSDGPLETMTVSDIDYFTQDLQFGGFTAPLAYPATASGANITWHFSDGTTRMDAVGDGETPLANPPAGTWVTGFDIVYDGPIDQGATATANFDISPTVAYVPPRQGSVSSTNTVDVAGTSGEKNATASATAGLEVFAPDINLNLTKTILPSQPVAPGGTVVVELPTTTSTDSAYVQPTTITVEDVAQTPHDDGSFWSAFNPVEIAPTQVPDGATLTIQYTTDDGTTWQDLPVAGLPAVGPTTFSADIPASLQGQITGLRFTYTNANGFPAGSTVQPNVSFQARGTQRYSSAQTSVPDAGPTVYNNAATAQGEAVVDGNTITGNDQDDADASIETHSGQGGLNVDKRWTDPTTFTTDLTAVDTQSGEKAGTVLSWGANQTGFSSMAVSDPSGTPADASQTVFQAFDLLAAAPVTLQQDPLLQWDTVSAVELFQNGVWVTVPPPAGGWMGDNGFVGYTLTGPETANTTGIRFTIVPNDAARTASSDPTRPAPGSGISASPSQRPFDLVWQLRNKLRVVPDDQTNIWVNASTVYNTTDDGVVRNSVEVSGVQNGQVFGPASDQDDVLLVDGNPGVSVEKSSQKSTIPVPNPGDVDPSGYPTNDFTITAHNTSPSRASYVRVTDPMPCTSGTVDNCTSLPARWDANPYSGYTYDASNPFDAFTLTGLVFSFNAGEVDADASAVTLLHRDSSGALSTTTTTITAAQAMTAPELADVVGVSVVYQGTDPASSGGTITTGDALVMTMHTQVRETLRGDPSTFVTPTTVSNASFAQAYDPVLKPSGQGSAPRDTASADVELTQGQLDIVATKTITPDSLLEANRTDQVDVTLTGSQGQAATVPTNRVTIADTDEEFWNEFTLTAFSAADVTLPAGADQVRVDVRLSGSTSWTMGTAGPSAVLPTTDLADVTGIRFVFDRADGGLFSHTAVPADFTAQAVLHVQLRDAARDGTAIPFPSTVNNTTTATSHRTEDSDLYPDVTADASDDIALDPGTFSIDVAKDPAGDQHTVAVGSSVPWTITFTNTGTGFLTVRDLVDALPDSLDWDGQPASYETSADGTLSTDVSLTSAPNGRTLTFTWPSGGRTMSPGETFTITLGVILQPGLQANERATNTMTVRTTQDLAACTNTSGNGQGATQDATNDCSTTNFVQPIPGPALLTTKAVNGDVVDSMVDGATNLSDPSATCTQDDEGFYISPCVADTRFGGTDEWRLRAVNSGTDAYSTVTFVDPLPFVGDTLLATGSARGSTYRPIFDGEHGVDIDAPDGAATSWEVTTDSSVCVGSDPSNSAWPADTTCTTNTWVDGESYAGAWSAVTGIRVVVDLSDAGGLAAGGLAAGGTVTAKYRTIDVPASVSDPAGLPRTVPAADQYAYNQTGTTATLVNGAQPLAQAPVKVGVTPLVGSLMVNKEITGDAADDAPDAFVADVSCTAASVELDLGAAAQLTMDAANDYQARIDGIPVGATCSIAEDGEPGSFGEANRVVDPGEVTIAQPSSSEDPVPAGQIVTITNRYDVHPTPPPSPQPTPPPNANGVLPGTGSDVVWTALAAILALVAGAAFAARAATRRRHRPADDVSG